ncbi:MAG TPA: hypothetical protein VH601_26290, partial [Bryobacteraceae bacterium]
MFLQCPSGDGHGGRVTATRQLEGLPVNWNHNREVVQSAGPIHGLLMMQELSSTRIVDVPTGTDTL